jgi:hypothetical protein
VLLVTDILSDARWVPVPIDSIHNVEYLFSPEELGGSHPYVRLYFVTAFGEKAKQIQAERLDHFRKNYSQYGPFPSFAPKKKVTLLGAMGNTESMVLPYSFAAHPTGSQRPFIYGEAVDRGDQTHSASFSPSLDKLNVSCQGEGGHNIGCEASSWVHAVARSFGGALIMRVQPHLAAERCTYRQLQQVVRRLHEC